MTWKITCGDTLNWPVTVPEYPASSGWSLVYRLVPRGAGTAIEVTAAADGDAYALQATAAETATWSAGEYSWASWVEYAGERHTLEAGSVTLLPNPATQTDSFDSRSQAEIAYAAAKAALASWTPTTRSYTINGRSMTFSSPDEIVRIVNYWANEVQREQRAARLAAGLGVSDRKVFVRMSRA